MKDLKTISAGQLWCLKEKTEDIQSYFVLIKDVKGGKAAVNVMFRWTELAGPEDLKLPKAFINSRAVYSFELSAIIADKYLSKCIGTIDDKSLAFIANAKKDLDKKLDRPPFNWGKGYLDEYDVRYKYHNDIKRDIERMIN